MKITYSGVKIVQRTIEDEIVAEHIVRTKSVIRLEHAYIHGVADYTIAPLM